MALDLTWAAVKETQKKASNVKFGPYDLFTLLAMDQINSGCNFMDF